MRVSELEGAELDYWVARALGLKVHDVNGKPDMKVVETGTDKIAYISPDHIYVPSFAPSSDWSRGGPIIERCRISVYYSGDYWVAVDEKVQEFSGRRGVLGPTPLVAAMRAVVASRFGDEVPSPTPTDREGA